MDDWKKYYEERLCTADEAVQLIRDDDHVVFGHCIAEPSMLIDAMVRNAASYRNVRIHHQYSFGKAEYTKPEYRENFIFDGWFLTGNTRDAVAAGYADFTPNHYYQADEFFEKGYFKCDVLMTMVSPPDEKGYVSLGTSVDYTRSALLHADRVLVQVNENMPVTYGDSFIHVSQIDRFVEGNVPLFETTMPEPGEKELQIGRYCASLIPDGSTISLGVGIIPDAVCYSLKDKRDLGVFSDMFSDGLVDLYEHGAINNRYTTTDPGVITVSFVIGTKHLYDFVDRNPAVRFKSASYVNHPFNIAQQRQMCIVNSSVAVDLTGQIVSASLGTYQFSGVGGQPSLNRGATMSVDRRGRGIIAMTSSVPDYSTGKMVSKITPFIAEGAEVSMTQEDANYVVTEYGIATLRGKSLEDRARALINISDPQFRDELVEEFERRFRTKYRISR